MCRLTFVLLLDLLVPGSLPEVGQDLSQLGDHDVIGGQGGLSLRDRTWGNVREREGTISGLCGIQIIQLENSDVLAWR